MSCPVYPQPLDVGVDGRWWDLAPLRLERAVALSHARPGRQVGLYTLHADGQLVYVGHSTNLGRRVAQHRRHAGQWVERIRVAWMAFEDVQEARRVEGMIASSTHRHRPPWNLTGYGRGRRSREIVDEWFSQPGATPAEFSQHHRLELYRAGDKGDDATTDPDCAPGIT